MNERERFQKLIEDPQPILATIIRMANAKGNREISGLLQDCIIAINQTSADGYNGGSYGYTISLTVDAEKFATIEEKLGMVEDTVHRLAASLIRDFQNHIFEALIIKPAIDGNLDRELVADVPLYPGSAETQIASIWTPGFFRLFVSHESIYKVKMSALKDKLAPYGVSAFIAHEDIEPDEEWRDIILVALQSCHGLAAMLTKDFHSSLWTDQEVGIAIGLGKPVIRIRVGRDPYGFLSTKQAVTGSLDQPRILAESIVKVLVKNTFTKSAMLEGLVKGLEEASTYDNAKIAGRFILSQKGFDESQLRRIAYACRDNSQVSDSDFGKLRPTLEAYLRAINPDVLKLDPPYNPFAEDEYDPFADD